MVHPIVAFWSGVSLLPATDIGRKVTLILKLTKIAAPLSQEVVEELGQLFEILRLDQELCWLDILDIELLEVP
jgi:hypothetical protein